MEKQQSMEKEFTIQHLCFKLHLRVLPDTLRLIAAYVALGLSRRQGRRSERHASNLFPPFLILQVGSGFPRKRCLNVHDSGQVCMFEGKIGRDFRAFTKYMYQVPMPAHFMTTILAEKRQEFFQSKDTNHYGDDYYS
ncbi:hypothetical protein [Dictyobacter formicarum]|uniref:hypothetical protein n=1 Tax=Dictyobacter formicarum TaxID=2778368 RepID=UPI00191647AB|nr:hypothetical protein [Dictyobacter formicarum]